MRIFWLLFGFYLRSSFGFIDPYDLDEFGEVLDDEELTNIARNLHVQRREEQLIKFENDWPSAKVFAKLGPISAAVPADPSGIETLVLHRADRIWDPRTFDENHVLRNISMGPIRTGVLAKLGDGELRGLHLDNRFYMPHGLTIDPNGNVWITDVGLHQVFKFGPDLKETPLLTLGQPLHPGTDEKHFCKPTHVVVATNGEFFVSDGYCNSRILKYDSKGKLITTWGQPTTDPLNPGPYDLNIPHEMILLEAEDLLCVADRENFRAPCYIAGLRPNTRNATGQFVDEFRTENVRPGPVYGIAYCHHTRSVFLLVGPTDEVNLAEVQVYNLDTKQYIGRITDQEQGFGDAHTISTCGSLEGSGCLLVSSVSKPARDLLGRERRRMWFYRLLSVALA